MLEELAHEVKIKIMDASKNTPSAASNLQSSRQKSRHKEVMFYVFQILLQNVGICARNILHGGQELINYTYDKCSLV